MRKGQVNDYGLGLIIGTLFGAMLMTLIFHFAVPDYKQGQIDYANGIIKYELKQQANGEKIWVERK